MPPGSPLDRRGLLDIDHFKKVNDTSAILPATPYCAKPRPAARQHAAYDQVGRYGGADSW